MLSEALRLVRVFHDTNQSQLAEKLGISKSYLSEIESGKKKPSIELLEKYYHVFNIRPSSLLFFSESLQNDKISEKVRMSVADKIIKIMNWLSETENNEDGQVR